MSAMMNAHWLSRSPILSCNGAYSFRIPAGESSEYICKVAHKTE